ncbi:MAG: hypothetical protein U9R01_02275 [candidate division WOR-3 bacterium]|nr:hypothetical protein [candidate division WOR-3 bacterium]
MTELMFYIAQRKKELHRLLAIDKALRADPYDNVARLIELEKVERIMERGTK